MIESERLAKCCRAMGVRTRAEILLLISRHPICVGALAARTGVTQSAVSQHLRILSDAGLVTGERMGHFVHYTIDGEQVRECIDLLEGLLTTSRESGQCTGRTTEGGEDRCATLTRNAKSRRT